MRWNHLKKKHKHRLGMGKHKACDWWSGLILIRSCSSGNLTWTSGPLPKDGMPQHFFVALLCSVMLGKFFLLDATSKCLKLQKMKEEITRWGRKFRRQTNWLQTGFKEACSKSFSQLENLFCWLFYCTILVLYLPAGSRCVWIITVLVSNGWPLPRRCSLDRAFLAVSWKVDLFLILWNLFVPYHDWDIMNAGCFSLTLHSVWILST